MKVFGGTDFVNNVQCRLIVAANTWKRARELLKAAGISGMTAFHMRMYWSQSWNRIEVAIASREGVWSTPLDGRKFTEDYTEVYK